MPPTTSLPPCPCAVCGKTFTPVHKRNRYCSKQCLWKSKNDSTRARRGEELKAQKRLRYATDPEYREKMLKRHKDWYSNDPELRRELSRRNFQRIRVDQPWVSLLYSAKNRAIKRGIPFTLTQEWAEARWTGCCEVSGLPFSIGARGNGPKPFSPSIDRIQSSEGYTPENCRFVLMAVNAARGDGTDEDLFAVAEALIRNRR